MEDRIYEICEDNFKPILIKEFNEKQKLVNSGKLSQTRINQIDLHKVYDKVIKQIIKEAPIYGNAIKNLQAIQASTRPVYNKLIQVVNRAVLEIISQMPNYELTNIRQLNNCLHYSILKTKNLRIAPNKTMIEKVANAITANGYDIKSTAPNAIDVLLKDSGKTLVHLNESDDRIFIKLGEDYDQFLERKKENKYANYGNTMLTHIGDLNQLMTVLEIVKPYMDAEPLGY